jgi:hypothetical protein
VRTWLVVTNSLPAYVLIVTALWSGNLGVHSVERGIWWRASLSGWLKSTHPAKSSVACVSVGARGDEVAVLEPPEPVKQNEPGGSPGEQGRQM